MDPTVDLKEFVTQTILEILEGVHEAQKEIDSHRVEFDVAVTASRGSEAKAGAGVVVAVLGFGTHPRKASRTPRSAAFALMCQ